MCLLGNLFDDVFGDLASASEIGCSFFLGDIDDFLFDFIDEFRSVFGLISPFDDVAAAVLDFSQNRFILDDVDIIQQIGCGRNGIDKISDIVGSAGLGQKILAFQAVDQRGIVNRHPFLEKALHGPEYNLVIGRKEIHVLQFVDDRFH